MAGIQFRGWSDVNHRTVIACSAVGMLAALVLAACNTPPLPVATVENPQTFPQPIVQAAPPPTEHPPPPVTENRTFVTIDGVPEYRIGRGDVLEIFLTQGAKQEKYETPVRANGRVSVAMVEVNVAGLTADQAAGAIRQALSTYFRRPMVEVLTKEFNSKKVTVLGALGGTSRSGVVALMGRTTLPQVIAKAGGFSPDAQIEQIRITRGTQTYSVNLFRYLAEGDLSQDVVLDAGDVVFIPERKKGEEQRVFLLGEVKTPGPVPLLPQMTLSQLIAQAGGWSNGALYEEARIIRPDTDKSEIIGINLARLVLDGDRRVDQYLRPNDIVYIPRTKIANWNVFLSQLRPTLEFFTLPLSPIIAIKAVGQ
jgi:protein involved in polysaccharide export with SLBB domain